MPLLCTLALFFAHIALLCAQTLETSRLKAVTALSDISKDKKYAFISFYNDKQYTLTAETKSNTAVMPLCLTDNPSEFSNSNLFSFTLKGKADSQYNVNITNLGTKQQLAWNSSSYNLTYTSSNKWKDEFYLLKDEDANGIYVQTGEKGGNDLRYSVSTSTFKMYSSSAETYPRAYLYEYDESNTVGSLTILTNEGYGTYYLDKDFVMPDGLKGALISNANEASGELEINWKYTPGTTVPANTALLVYGTKGTTYALEAPTTSATVSVRSTEEEANLLRGSVKEELTTAPDGQDAANCYFYQMYYVTKLNEGQKQLGFFWGAEQGGTFTNGANKAYLVLPKASTVSIKGFTLPFGDNTSSIAPVTDNVNKSSTIYTLSGKPYKTNATKNLPKGVYIINGKKVIR